MKAKFNIPVFNVDVHVIVCDDMEKELRSLMKHYQEERDEEWYEPARIGAAIASVVSSERLVNALLFDEQELTTGIVHHEIFHLVCHICDQTGIKLGNTEACASIAGYAGAKVMELINKAGCKIHQ